MIYCPMTMPGLQLMTMADQFVNITMYYMYIYNGSYNKTRLKYPKVINKTLSADDLDFNLARWIVVGVSTPVMVWILVSNLLTMVVICKTKTLKTKTYSFICLLCSRV